MISKTSFSKIVMVTGALFFSMSATAAKPVKSSPDSSNCISNSAITSTALSRTGASGPFAVSTKDVPRFTVDGFGGGTIHYPTNASGCGLMGGIAVVPGYISYEDSIKWWGPRLASWGFVVITINTNSIYDNPDSRANQLSAALDHIISDSTVGSMVDSNKLGAIGWSMGGGGTLKLAANRNSVRAIIPQAPFYTGSYGAMNTPAFMIGCQYDTTAPTALHVNPFYNNAAGSKMKVEVKYGDHFCANSGYNEALLGKPGIAWMQRYIHGDTRFNQFLCANENYGKDTKVSAYNYARCL